MSKRFIVGLFAILGLMLSAAAGTSASATTTEFRLSIKHDGVRTSAGEETLRYSPMWDGGSNETAKVTLSEGDAVLSENLTAEGDYAWSVSTNGTYNLTHTTYTNGAVAKVLNASFVVTGLPDPFPPGSVTATGYNGKYDGNGHGITVTTEGISSPTITYARTEAGPYTETNPLFTNVCNETVWYVVAAPGYITETNSAKVVITQGDIGGSGGEEPGTGEIPEGGISKFDATYVYDGQGHTIKTNELVAAANAAVKGAVAMVTYGRAVCPTPPSAEPPVDIEWVADAPSVTNSGEYVLWYQITAPNYSNYVHAAKVTIARPACTIANVTAHQRYPWNGKVDIDFTLESPDPTAKYDVTFSAKDVAGGTNLSMKIVYCGDVVSVTNQLAAGRHRVAWDASADLGAIGMDDVEITIETDAALGGVQLWENGPCWADCNVGAMKPEEYGYYFWWGDTIGYKRNEANNGWISVKDGTTFSFTTENCPTYGKNNSQLQSEGYIHTTGNLVAAHDAATAHLGTPWRMPTDIEVDALAKNCIATLITTNGVYGRLVKGKGAYSSKSIFLPLAGWGGDSNLNSPGYYGYGVYWSSTQISNFPNDAASLLFNRSSIFTMSVVYERSRGHTVRPVHDGQGTGMTAHLKLDCRMGVRVSEGEETLRYSPLWDGGSNETAMVTLKQGDTTLAADLTGEGEYNWSVAKPGLYTLTHSTYTNGAVAKTLTAQFNVSGVPVDPAEITVTPYEAEYDGAAHGISVVGPEGTTVKYCATSNGAYAAEMTFKDVCTTQIWYEVSGGGYLSYTNSA